MLSLILLLVVACAHAQTDIDPALKECAMECQRVHKYYYGANGMQQDPGPLYSHQFFFANREYNEQEWVDENDQSSNGAAKLHAKGWMGPDTGFENHFQIVGKVDGKPQTIRVYHKDKLVDIIEDPKNFTVGSFSTVNYPNDLTKQNECIWNKCLEPSNSTFAPLHIGEQCLALENHLFVTYLSYGYDYHRNASPGPSCGYWTLSIRTKWYNDLKVVRADSSPSDQEDYQKIKDELAQLKAAAGN